jgi:hypothetical protein
LRAATEPRAQLDRRARPDLRACRASRAKSGLPVPRVLRACKASRVKLALRGRTEPPGPKEKQARTGLQVLKVK